MENKDTQSVSSQSQVATPETLKVDQSAVSVLANDGTNANQTTSSSTTKNRRLTYRPSHKATFLGLAAIAVFLIINVVVLWFLFRSQTQAQTELINNGVTLSSDTLSSLGVNRQSVGEATELTVGPNATFRGTVTIAKDVSISGNLKLNSSFTADSGSFGSLKTGDATLNSLKVSGDTTLSNLGVANDVTVAGAARVQGQATFSQLVTVNNNLNVAGSLAVGGTISTRSFDATNLVASGMLTIGGHIVTRGTSPTLSSGNALGNGGTVSVNGTDMAGTVSVNIGNGSSAGVIASISFHQAYSSIPRVTVSPIGGPMPGLYVNRTASGFTVSTSSALSQGSYAIDFIVIQ